MGMRRDARELAVQFLFQRDFQSEDLPKELAAFWLEWGITGRTKDFAEALVLGVEEHRQDVDERIRNYAENWDINRMDVVDRNIMRLALYEMFYCREIPPVVSINEAVDIARDFGGEESGRFVNGILDRALRDLSRPAREAASGPL